MKRIVVYADGSCWPTNGGPGGYAGVRVDTSTKDVHEVILGSAKTTTNNRMEILAVLCAMKEYVDTQRKFTIYSDSAYVCNSLGSWYEGQPTGEQWIIKWHRRGWGKGLGQVKNADLWRQAWQLVRYHTEVKLVKVKGHKGNLYNEIADVCAGKARKHQLGGRYDSESWYDLVMEDSKILKLFGMKK